MHPRPLAPAATLRPMTNAHAHTIAHTRCAAVRPQERDRRPARQPEPPHARRVRRRASSRRRTSTASPRASVRFTQPPHRLAAVHAGAPRHALSARSTSSGGRGARSRCGRTPITAYAARAPASRRCSSPTIRTCSRPAARTTTPTSRLGLRARPRERPVEDAARPVVARRAARSAGGRMPLRQLARLVPRRGRLPRPADDARRRALARRRTPARHDRFFLFVDEFDPHEPFDTPEPYASMYDDDVGRRRT